MKQSGKGSVDTAGKGGAEVLRQLDQTSFRWFHVKTILIAGAGFFTDSYDLFTVGIISPMIAYSVFPDHTKNGGFGSLPRGPDLAVKGTALVGTLLGQVIFGAIGDRLGRKKTYGWELLIMFLAVLLNAASTWGPPDVYIFLFCFWRFWLGLGIGGDYPMSAVITSEYTSTHFRGAMMAAVFSMQGIGIMCAAVTSVVVLACFRRGIEACTPGLSCHALDNAWRVIVAVGGIPAVATFYIRRRLPETPRFTLHVEGDAQKTAADVTAVFENDIEAFQKLEAEHKTPEAAKKITFRDFHRWCMVRRNFLVLFGTTASWFLLDVAYYCQNLYNPAVIADVGFAKKVTATSTGRDIYDSVSKQAVGNLVLVVMGLIPGYYVSVATIDKIGRKAIQYLGFAMMTVLLIIVSAAYNQLRARAIWAFIILYALTFFFANFGPNTTTFIIPGECFPTKYRTTCHGISAAAGKAGAILGVFGFGALVDESGFQITLGALSIFMFAGLISTIFVPETKGKSLEEINDEYSDEVPLPSFSPAMKVAGHKAAAQAEREVADTAAAGTRKDVSAV